MKLAIIDIDGVLVNCTKRIEAATTDGKIDWDQALNSNALHLDELIPQAVEHLAVIREHYDQIVLLTSRYDHMRDASLAWLKEHGVTGYERAIFKSWDDRFVKTKLWKAVQVITLLQEASQTDRWNRLPSTPITELLIIEDHEDNQVAIREEIAHWIMHNRQMKAHYFVSLEDAVKAIKEEEN